MPKRPCRVDSLLSMPQGWFSGRETQSPFGGKRFLLLNTCDSSQCTTGGAAAELHPHTAHQELRTYAMICVGYQRDARTCMCRWRGKPIFWVLKRDQR